MGRTPLKPKEGLNGPPEGSPQLQVAGPQLPGSHPVATAARRVGRPDGATHRRSFDSRLDWLLRANARATISEGSLD